jgi:hypothetical protein
MTTTKVHLSVAPANGKPQRVVDAHIDGQSFRDTFDTNSERSRRRFIDKVAQRFKLDRNDLVGLDLELVELADAADAEVECQAAALAASSVAAQAGIGPELDVSRIIRPERFITPVVSGISVAAIGGDLGQPTPQWRLYLRSASGRRECRLLASTLQLLDSCMLFVHPVPPLPPINSPPGWSAAARQAWLKGAPAPCPIAVFRQLCERFAYFVDLPGDRAEGVSATLALWVMLTYCYPTWSAVPYLYLGGPKGSGKTRVFEVLSRLVFRPFLSSSVTGAAMFRTLHDRGGTLLLDEAERLRQPKDPATSELLAMLLAGYKRGGQATRLERVNDAFGTSTFDVYGPKALACICGLPLPLKSRCIAITMAPAAPVSEKPRRRIDAEPSKWQQLRDDLHAIAMEYADVWLALPDLDEVCPPMSGRDFELWQPLLALASWLDELGVTGLLKRAQRHALMTIEASREQERQDCDVILLCVLAEALRNGQLLSPGDIQKKAQELDASFRFWSPKLVASQLELYGLETRKYHGRMVYPRTSLDLLWGIEGNYGFDLGLRSGQGRN